MDRAISDANIKVRESALQGRRTLLLLFYAGHGAETPDGTVALLNSGERGEASNYYPLEFMFRFSFAEVKGSYFLGLLACSRGRFP